MPVYIMQMWNNCQDATLLQALLNMGDQLYSLEKPLICALECTFTVVGLANFHSDHSLRCCCGRVLNKVIIRSLNDRVSNVFNSAMQVHACPFACLLCKPYRPVYLADCSSYHFTGVWICAIFLKVWSITTECLLPVTNFLVQLLRLFVTTYAPEVPNRDLQNCVSDLVNILLEKLGDSNVRTREAASEALMFLASKKEIGLHVVAVPLLRPPKNQVRTCSRNSDRKPVPMIHSRQKS